MPLEQINLNELRVFHAVFTEGSMTAAARKLHLTQSGISQHISSLEESLELQLFDRIKGRLYPTTAARSLFDVCQDSFEQLNLCLRELKGGSQTLHGKLRIGSPTDFGALTLSPLLGSFVCSHPGLSFELHFAYSARLIDSLLKGDIDVAYIDAFADSPVLDSEVVYTEALDLCVSAALLERMQGAKDGSAPKALKTPSRIDELLALPYVDYENKEPLVWSWYRHHFSLKAPKLHLQAVAPSTEGVKQLVAAGVGCGILPRASHLRDPNLIAIKAEAPPLLNTIKMATLKGRSPDQASQILLCWIKEQLAKSCHIQTLSKTKAPLRARQNKEASSFTG